MPEDSNTEASQPAPEELQPQDASSSQSALNSQVPEGAKGADKPAKDKRRGSYRPSHKATFIALIVVIAILAINAGAIVFVLKRQTDLKQKVDTGPVTISQSALAKLGVSQSPVKSRGLKLTVNPDAEFNGDVKIAGATSIAGQLTLNNNFTAASASFTKLQAGDTQLSGLNVNGDATASNLNLRSNLTVTGQSQLQGRVTVPSLLTAASINVTGNLTVGGTLAVGNLRVSSLTSDTTLTIGGHLITQGATPGVSRGSVLGSNGTVSINGNDAAGTVTANAGVGASSGQVACVTFSTAYAATPRVVVTPSAPVDAYVVARSASGFCIGVGNTLSPGGYSFDYIVEQ